MIALSSILGVSSWWSADKRSESRPRSGCPRRGERSAVLAVARVMAMATSWAAAVEHAVSTRWSDLAMGR
jgi:hypothetical protein